jgi:regulator of sigma E protease
MQAIAQFLLTVVVGVLMLAVLVFVHELGHYLFAKMFGMRVNAFAIFMGGLRKTDLTPWLPKPLAPVGWLWLAFALGVVAAAVGAVSSRSWLYLGGMGLAGVVVPAWAMARMAALYHMPVTKFLATWGKCIVVGVLVLALGTKLRGISPEMLMGIVTGATLVALAMAYYSPVGTKDFESDAQGFGQIEVAGREGAEVVPVRYRPVWYRNMKDGTEFSLLLLPLGGFAQIAGMHPKEDGSEALVPDGFFSRAPWKRFLVLFAGPLFSIGFGLILLFGLFASNGKEVPDTRPIVGPFVEGMPSNAYDAGLREGDVIKAIDGKPIHDFYDMIVAVNQKWREASDGKREGIPVAVTYAHDGIDHTVTITPLVDDEPAPLRDRNLEILPETAIQARLGILYMTKHVNLSAGEAFAEAVKAPVEMVKGLIGVVARPSTAKDQVGGPAAMAKVTTAAVENGVYTVLMFAAVLSISLGVMNLLPIVPLDGGQMVVAFVEMLRGGKRLSLGVQNWLANSGIAILVVMMLAVFSVDLGRSAKENQAPDKPAIEHPNSK